MGSQNIKNEKNRELFEMKHEGLWILFDDGLVHLINCRRDYWYWTLKSDHLVIHQGLCPNDTITNTKILSKSRRYKCGETIGVCSSSRASFIPRATCYCYSLVRYRKGQDGMIELVTICIN